LNRRFLFWLGCCLSLSLACNLLASPGRYLPTQKNLPANPFPLSDSPTVKSSSASSLTPSLQYPYTIREQTLFEGEKIYTCDPGGCWREDGDLAGPPDYFFPDLNRENAEIKMMLSAIGLPASVAEEDGERWLRIVRVWSWMKSDALPLGAPGQGEAWKYLQNLMETPQDHWPSISDMANVYSRYQVLPVGACNSTALTFATLLYRSGIPPDVLSVAHTKTKDVQHLYVVLRLEGKWHFLDPMCIPERTKLSEKPESVGCVGADYRHPYQLELLPGSNLPKPMLVE